MFSPLNPELKYAVFLDESGDLSFSRNSATKYFVLTALIIEHEKLGEIRNIIKKNHAHLYRLGWPKNIEIKAYTLHRIQKDPALASEIGLSIDGDAFISKILTSISHSNNIKIDYIAVNKNKITSSGLRTAEYGIAYNYFSKELLTPIIMSTKQCVLTIDQRNKEIHTKKHFNEYLKTTILDECLKCKREIALDIHHADSHLHYGLQAVDYVSWSIYRQIVEKDDSFLNIIKRQLRKYSEWYCG